MSWCRNKDHIINTKKVISIDKDEINGVDDYDNFRNFIIFNCVGGYRISIEFDTKESRNKEFEKLSDMLIMEE